MSRPHDPVQRERHIKTLCVVCNGMAAFFMLGMISGADGMMEAYGPMAFFLFGLFCLTSACLLSRAADWLERRIRKSRPRYHNYQGRQQNSKHQHLLLHYKGRRENFQDGGNQ